MGKEAIGNLDGIQRYQDGFLLSDWKVGVVYDVNSVGEAKQLIDTEQSSGDIAYLPKQDMILVPMNKQGQVQAYKRTAAK